MARRSKRLKQFQFASADFTPLKWGVNEICNLFAAAHELSFGAKVPPTGHGI
jgi:hypothetical protein